MVGNSPVGFLLERGFLLLEEMGQELSVVLNLEFPFEGGVLIGKNVETMG